jgi:glycosyltransferase involved in cell wall biosynthesis
MKKKIAYFLSHPIQYFSPLLKEMAKEFDLHVCYFSDPGAKGSIDKGFGQAIKWDVPLLEGYDYTFIKNYSPRRSTDLKFFDLINPGVIKYLRKGKSNVVIVSGWIYFSYIITIISAKLMGKKVWVRAENTYSKEITKNAFLLLIKKVMLKGFLFRLFIDRYLFIGKDNKEFFKLYGAKDEQLVYTPYCVNNDFFATFYEESKNKKNELRIKLGMPVDKKVILFTGKYQKVKRPLDLMQAFHELNLQNTLLVMVGEGELRNEMEDYIKVNQLQNVLLTGFINQSAIPQYYSIADIFVLCSESETWGLSVNEAMNFALPVVVSNTVGCSYDLIDNGINGYIYEKADIKLLTECLKKLVDNDELRLEMGQAGIRKIKEFSYAATVENIRKQLYS